MSKSVSLLMMRKWSVLFLSFLAGILPALALDLTVIQAQRSGANTWVWLHHTPHRAEAAVLRFTDSRTGRLVYEWRGIWQGNAPAWLRLSLPAGGYQVQAWCDAAAAKATYLCQPTDAESLFMSDLVLAKSPFRLLGAAQPLPYNNGLPVTGWLGIAIEGNAPEPLALRAALYRRSFGTALANTYQPVQEYAQIVPPGSNTVWTVPLDMAALPEGEYRQEIRLYRGEELVGRRTLPFVRPSAGESSILADVYTAIDQMRYVFPAAVCDSLRAIRPAAAAFAAWRSTWEQHYGPDATAQIRGYYDRITAATNQFGSWRCLEAALWARFGPPVGIRNTGKQVFWRYRFGEVKVKG